MGYEEREKYQHMISKEKLGYSRAEMIYSTMNEGVP